MLKAQITKINILFDFNQIEKIRTKFFNCCCQVLQKVLIEFLKKTSRANSSFGNFQALCLTIPGEIFSYQILSLKHIDLKIRL